MSELLNKKAFDISFAVFRVAALVKKPPLCFELEKLATEFVSLVGRSSLDEALNLSSALKSVIKLGEVTFEIKQINAGVLLREIGSFESLARVESGKDLEIESLFFQPSLLKTSSAKPSLAPAELSSAQAKTELNFANNPARIRQEFGSNPARAIENSANNSARNQENAVNAVNNPAMNPANNSAIIQEEFGKAELDSNNADLILARIRQLNDCRTKDLLSFFPHLSERTLRGYLKLLCDQGLVERLGAGGPDTHYQIKAQPLQPLI